MSSSVMHFFSGIESLGLFALCFICFMLYLNNNSRWSLAIFVGVATMTVTELEGLNTAVAVLFGDTEFGGGSPYPLFYKLKGLIFFAGLLVSVVGFGGLATFYESRNRS